MDWTRLLLVSIIAIGGFTAAVYETLARRLGLPVGYYFRINGIMTIIGGFITFIAIILSAVINPWWSMFIVFICGWLFSQLLISVFKTATQIISMLLIISGAILLAINIFNK